MFAQSPLIKPDDEEMGLQRRLLILSTLMMTGAAVFWSALYGYFGEIGAAAIPGTYVILSLASLLTLKLRHGFTLLRSSQLACSLLLPFFLMWELGGFVNSSAVVVWSFTSPIGALMFAGRRQAALWFIGFILLVSIGSTIEYPAVTIDNLLPAGVVVVLFVMNLSGVSIVAFVMMSYFVKQKNTALDLLSLERRRSEQLIENMLPASISERLKNEQRPIADQLDNVTIIFADIVGFTGYAMDHDPDEIVLLLDRIFSDFDRLSAEQGLEKIKTIGDAYMVCSGLQGTAETNARGAAHFALAAMADLTKIVKEERLDLNLRIGIHTGTVVAGVIGEQKYSYDIWGDAVNIAARLQQTALPGKILISRDTVDLISDHFETVPQGTTTLKGHTPVDTFVLAGSKA
ncbi:adenylate/guanylate cyclase domain-containing protein [Sneathiella marina]|uniref:Adenylate/guanylate cyclase domain-containing protein n=1 Tax=Sneathiella marina TaxID=2950108 RepID=A0ABY4W3R6_9PROT|nr:adenylate/guanylate cyclase domain-containing protein [Sneathiella marina]USG61554.1 adenylate/guanylate cyclase domain-containing protein [Sneathiella marina]